jgi:hypothetical protein
MRRTCPCAPFYDIHLSSAKLYSLAAKGKTRETCNVPRRLTVLGWAPSKVQASPGIDGKRSMKSLLPTSQQNRYRDGMCEPVPKASENGIAVGV